MHTNDDMVKMLTYLIIVHTVFATRSAGPQWPIKKLTIHADLEDIISVFRQ